MTGILVHEWLSQSGGSENVFEDLGKVYPDAEQWCAWNDSSGRFSAVHETFLARTPLRRSKAIALPVMPFAWRTLPARQADWVLCSSHAFAHHARFGGDAANAPKLVYAHTPARYVWVPDMDSRGRGLAARTVSRALRPLDRKRAREASSIAANSKYVAERIADTWQQQATVIYPPVDVAAFDTPPQLTPDEYKLLSSLPDGFVLGASRFVAYKRLDESIRAGALTRRPVVIAGSGPDEARLREYAERSGAEVRFVLSPSSSLLRALYREASVFVFAPVEDFGIMPVEAMAAGTPVVVSSVGGASESVWDGVTGSHVSTWAPDELRAAIDEATALQPADCRSRAQDFGRDRFADQIRAWVDQTVGAHA